MGDNRDAANDVYEALHFTRNVVSTESAPASASDGVSTTGFNVLFFGAKVLGDTSDYQYVLWYYDGSQWLPVEDSTTLAVEDFDPSADHAQHYNIAAVRRIAIQITAITRTSGSVQVTTNIGV